MIVSPELAKLEDWQLERPLKIPREYGKFVYFVQECDIEDLAAEPIKIGVAAWPKERLATLQTGNSRKLVVRQAIVGGVAAETRLHRVWRRQGAWIRDEWFGNGHQRAILAVAFEIATRQLETFVSGRRVEERMAGCVDDVLRRRSAA